MTFIATSQRPSYFYRFAHLPCDNMLSCYVQERRERSQVTISSGGPYCQSMGHLSRRASKQARRDDRVFTPSRIVLIHPAFILLLAACLIA